MSDQAPREPTQRGAVDPELSGIVLSGGRSSRMGSDKCALEIEGRSLLQRVVDALGEVVDEIVVVGAPGGPRPEVRSRVARRCKTDPFEGAGPLVAIAAGLETARAPVAVVVACDLPYLEPSLLRLLADRAQAGAQLVVPLYDGRPQLLCGAWRRDALPIVRERIDAGERAVAAAAEALHAELLPEEAYAHLDPGGRSFVNVNTPEQLAAARAQQAAG